MATEQVRYTYLDYLSLPESVERRELIDGEFYAMTAPNEDHQDAVFNIAVALRQFVIAFGLGKVFIAPFDVILSPDDVYQPDVLFMSRERMHLRTGDNIRGAPDLVVEVLSPSTERFDRTVKRERYAKFGVREYWIADIVRKTIEVNVSDGERFAVAGVYGEGNELESPLLPELRIDVSSVFESAMH